MNTPPALKDGLASELDQVLSHWRKIKPERLLVRADSLIKNVNRGDLSALGQSIRRFHNQLGYQAWGDAGDGGQCTGCLYRSAAFIKVNAEDRRSREEDGLPVTIHLEHTIPVAIWIGQIQGLVASGANRDEILRVVLANSIAVGVHFMQRHGDGNLVKPGLNAHSHVFTPGHEDEGFPFRRYREVDDSGYKIINVVTGEQVNLQTHTLERARADLVELVKLSGNDKGLLDWLI